MRVTFWGTRGSIAAPGPRTVRYGGNTSCVEVWTDNGTLLILDSGTGIRELGQKLMAQGRELRGHVLLSHTHWDHIQGWPFFVPAFIPQNHFTIHAIAGNHSHLETVLANQMEYHYFPVTFDSMAAKIRVEEIHEGALDLDGVKVTTHYMNHTCVCLGFRIEADGKTLVYATDTEPHGQAMEARMGKPLAPTPHKAHLAHDRDKHLAEFVAGADLLVTDAQYTDEEYPKKVGWGHASTSFATDIAVMGKVKRLALFHHDPTHGDQTVNEIVATSTARAAGYESGVRVIGACEGDTIEL